MGRFASAVLLIFVCWELPVRAFQNGTGLAPLTAQEREFFQQAPFRIAEARNDVERGKARELGNDFAGALAAYKSAGDILQKQEDGHLSLREAYASAALLEAGVRLDQARMMNFLGQKRANDYNLALLDAKKTALFLVSNDIEAGRGTCELPAGPRSPARAYFVRLWIENPLPGHRFVAYVIAAKVELMQNHLELAKSCYQKAQQIDPTSAEVQQSLVSIDRVLPAAANPKLCPTCLTKTEREFVDAGISVGAALIAEAHPEGAAISAAVLTLINHLFPEKATEPAR